MHRKPAALILAILACLSMYSLHAAAQAGDGAVGGTVLDSSGGALPGVTVVATTTDGRVLGTTVTNGSGAYEISALPSAEMRITFQMDGFVPAAEAVTVRAGFLATVQKQLEVAPVLETVEVVGQAPELAQTRTVLSPPVPTLVPLPIHDQESVCGPAKPNQIPESLGKIRSRRLEGGRELYTKDDEVLIDGGTLDGLEVGQNLAVRRYFLVVDAKGAAMKGEHTAGVLQIVTAEDHVSSAVVVYACDEMRKGDFLAPFRPEPKRAADPVGVPAFADAAKILFADSGQTLGAPGRLMVIDRGVEHGIHAGQRLTLFRRRLIDPAKPSVVGEAVVVATRGDSATIRVEAITDAIASGDWAAPQRRSNVPTATAGGGTNADGRGSRQQ
jgi:hypothetical protein